MVQRSASAPTRMVFLLHGEDPFRTRLRLVELVRSLVAGGDGGVTEGDLAALASPALGALLGVTRHDASVKLFDSALITLSGQSQGLFDAPGERRVIVVDHAEALPDASFLDGFPPEAALVLVAHEKIAPPGRRAPTRGKSQAAKVSSLALPDAVVAAGGRVERVGRLDPDALRRWITARAVLHRAVLSPDALAELETLGPDTERLEHELGKLAAYAAGATITVSDVHQLVSGAIDLDIFKLTSAVVQRDTRAAISTLERLLADGQAVQQILALLLWQFRVLLFAIQLDRAPSQQGGPRPDPDTMARAIRSSPGAILRLRSVARSVRRPDIIRAYESLYATDVAIKSGRVDSDLAAIMLCVLDLCGVRNAGTTELLEIPMSRR